MALIEQFMSQSPDRAGLSMASRSKSPTIRFSLAELIQDPVKINKLSIKGRYELHSLHMGVLRENKEIERKIEDEDHQMEVLKKDLYKSTKKLRKIEQDEIMMRQDISTYECHMTRGIKLHKRCTDITDCIDRFNQSCAE